jgi:hypothetical protein
MLERLLKIPESYTVSGGGGPGDDDDDIVDTQAAHSTRTRVMLYTVNFDRGPVYDKFLAVSKE